MRYIHLAPQSQREWRCSRCDKTIKPGTLGDPSSPDKEEAMDDKIKMEMRNCKSITNKSLYFEWMPELRLCPKGQILGRPLELYNDWWEWKHSNYQLLPYGSHTLGEEPAFVAEAFMLIEHEINKIQNQQNLEQVNG